MSVIVRSLDVNAHACICSRRPVYEAHHVVTASFSYCSSLPPFISRKETRATCVCVRLPLPLRCICVCLRASKWSHSYYIKQDFPEQSAPATELPKSSSGFPPQHKVRGRAEARLFVLELHCSGEAEAMSQHYRHISHLPRRTSIIKYLGAFMSPRFH